MNVIYGKLRKTSGEINDDIADLVSFWVFERGADSKTGDEEVRLLLGVVITDEKSEKFKSILSFGLVIILVLLLPFSFSSSHIMRVCSRIHLSKSTMSYFYN
jgi:hypothetical protein